MSQKNPEGFATLTPHLVVNDPVAAIEFYKKVFGAVEKLRMEIPGTKQIMHAELQIGNSTLMLAGEFDGPGCSSKSPSTLGGSPVTIHIYVDDVDASFNKALAAGAQQVMSPADMFWGDRYGKVKDPFGHEWSLATHVRDMSHDEMMAAAAESFKQPVA